MKKSVMALALLTISTTAMADRLNVDVNFNGDRLRNCRETVRNLRDQNVVLNSSVDSLSSELQSCRANGSGRGNRQLRRQLREANEIIAQNDTTINRLENKIDRKNDRIEELKRDIRDLEDQLNPAPPLFDLAASVRECGGISNSSHARECTSYARKFEIQAPVIKACAKLSNSYYAKECVKTAGEFGGNEYQVRACLKINNSSHARECVSFASKGNVPSSVVDSCVTTSNNSYYQKECVKSMMAN